MLALGALSMAFLGCWSDVRPMGFEAQLYDRHSSLGALCTPACEGGSVCWDNQCRLRDEVVQIEAGDGFTCALKASGTVWCWGSNADRTLGQPAGVQSLVQPTRVPGLSDVVEIASGYAHSCALQRSGAVRCWGLNHAGQLGDGTTQSPQHKPVAVVGVEEAIQISVGVFHSCALMRTGEIQCWGSGEHGELGHGQVATESRPVKVLGIENAVLVRAGDGSSCALLATGDVRCWGLLGQRESTQPGHVGSMSTPAFVEFAEEVAGLRLGSGMACFRQHDGEVHCWGRGEGGQLGDGAGSNSTLPVRVSGLRTAREVALGLIGKGFGCALNEDRTVSCWGHNEGGQLGDGTTLTRLEPVELPGLYGVVELAAGAKHVCARRMDGDLWCWGENASGQLGDGTTIPFHTLPTPVHGL